MMRNKFKMFLVVMLAVSFLGVGCGSGDSAIEVSSVKLIRPDAVEMELTDTPIPLSSTIKCVFVKAVENKADRDEFEGIAILKDSNGVEVTGSYAWADDFSYVIFSPAKRFEYGTEYTITLTEDETDTTKATVDSGTFKTMVFRDINGDGYSDEVVGAPLYSSLKGRAYIFLGSSDGISSKTADKANAKITGDIEDLTFGSSLSLGGDLNGDGFADLVVGANSYSTFKGRIYVFFGSNDGIASKTSDKADAIISGEANNNVFGFSNSLGGDINGDGFDDLVVGAFLHSSSTGRVYVFLGSKDVVSIRTADKADTIIQGESSGDAFAYSVSSGGDINGDGYYDLIAGSPGASDDKGKTYIFLGAGDGIENKSASKADAVLTGATDGEAIGASVTNSADINGDGYDDVAVGAVGYLDEKGGVFVFLGSADGIATKLSGKADTIIVGESVDSAFGYILSSAGDINGDGFDDLIADSFAYSDAKGRAYLFLGSSDGIANKTADKANTIITGEVKGDFFGSSCSPAGDINGDGFDDVIIGAPPRAGLKGSVYIFLGSEDGILTEEASKANTILTGEVQINFFGIVNSFLGGI